MDHDSKPKSAGDLPEPEIESTEMQSVDKLLLALGQVIDEINRDAVTSREELATLVRELTTWTSVRGKSDMHWLMSTVGHTDGSLTMFRVINTDCKGSDVADPFTVAASLSSADAVRVAHYSADAISAMGMDGPSQDQQTLERLNRASSPKYHQDMPHYVADSYEDDELTNRLLDLWSEHVTVFSLDLHTAPTPPLDMGRTLERIITASAHEYADERMPLMQANELRNRVLYDTSLSDGDRAVLNNQLSYLLRDYEGDIRAAAGEWFATVDSRSGPEEAYAIRPSVIRDMGRDIILTTGRFVDITKSISQGVKATITSSKKV